MTAEATLPILAAFTGQKLCLLRVDGPRQLLGSSFCTQTATKRSMSCDAKARYQTFFATNKTKSFHSPYDFLKVSAVSRRSCKESCRSLCVSSACSL